MKRMDVEHLVRRIAWPEPPPHLRVRVLSDPSMAARSIAGAARVARDRDPERHPRIPTLDAVAESGPWWRRASILVAVSILLMVGSCAGLDVWADGRVDAEVARIEARYGSLAEQTKKVPAVPADDNRALIVRAAAALAVGLPGQQYHYIVSVPSPIPADLRAFADANRAAIRLAADIRTRRQSNWESDLRDRGWPPFDAIRILSDAIYVDTLLELEAGHPDEASTLIVSGLGIWASMRQEPEPTSHMTRTGGMRRPIDAIQRLLTTSAPSPAALNELAWWLNENRTSDGMLAPLLGEVREINALFTRMERGDIDGNTAGYIYPMTWPQWPSAYLGVAARIGRPFVRTAHLRYLEYMEQLLDAEAGARPRPAVAEPPTPQRWALIDRLTDKFTSGTSRYSEVEDDFVSELNAVELAVALRRFKLDHVSYPDDLPALVPAYLARMPIDPFTGQPPVYARQGEGFTIRARASSPDMEKWLGLEWNVAK